MTTENRSQRPLFHTLYLSSDGGAEFSVDGRMRYLLWRARLPLPLFDGHVEREAGLGTIAFVMANPSVAGSVDDDPSIRRVRGFATDLGYNRFVVANTNPYVSTDPSRTVIPEERYLAINDLALRAVAEGAALVIAAWGTVADRGLAARAEAVLRRYGDPHVLGLTERGGLPRHPLYLPRASRPRPWSPAGRSGSGR